MASILDVATFVELSHEIVHTYGADESRPETTTLGTKNIAKHTSKYIHEIYQVPSGGPAWPWGAGPRPTRAHEYTLYLPTVFTSTRIPASPAGDEVCICA